MQDVTAKLLSESLDLLFHNCEKNMIMKRGIDSAFSYYSIFPTTVFERKVLVTKNRSIKVPDAIDTDFIMVSVTTELSKMQEICIEK